MELGSIFSINEYPLGYDFAMANGYTIAEVESRKEWQEKEVEIINDKGETEIKKEKELVLVRYFQIVEIPTPTEKELACQRISELKAKLASTDYVVIKIAEGETNAEEYSEILAQRKAWRAEINQLEALGA